MKSFGASVASSSIIMSAIRRVARAPGARAPGTWSTGDTPRRTGCSHSRSTSSSTIMIFFRWKYFCSVISFYLSVGHAVVQVTGSSFYLWVLECYPCMVKLVEFLMQEVTNWLWPRVERDDPTNPCQAHSTINSSQCQELMVWKIFSVESIFLSPLRDEFTL